MPALDLATRKKSLVQELNGFITAKKDFSSAATVKAELTGANSPRGAKPGLAPKSQQGDAHTCQLFTLLQGSQMTLCFQGLHALGCACMLELERNFHQSHDLQGSTSVDPRGLAKVMLHDYSF